MAAAEPLWALGLMSGTSMDGVDAALVHTDGETIAAFGPGRMTEYSRVEARLLLGGAEAARGTATDILRQPARWPLPVRAAAATATETHARAVAALGGAPSVIGFHGQTLIHRPDEGFTLQVGGGAQLAARLGVDVVSDFRSADMAAGGQGAPLVPVFHAALARRLGIAGPVAVLNIGGVANVTYLDDRTGDLIAFDTGPGNALLNDWMAAMRGAAFDEGGATALAGRADMARVGRWLEVPFHAAPPPKSLDRSSFKAVLADMGDLGPEDGAATLAAYTVEAVGAALRWFPRRPQHWLLCGGGRRNGALLAGLVRRLNADVQPVEAVGLDGDLIEAQAFAFLAVRVLRGLPTTFPGTTGCARPICGGRIDRA